MSFPAVICAKILGIPTVIHEQNALPGLTNRLLSAFAGIVAVSFASSKKYFPAGKTVVTGNPVRKDLFKKPSKSTYESFGLSEGKFTVLVFGGSQGASKINRAAIDSFQYLAGIKEKIQFLNISGRNDHEQIEKEYISNGIPGSVIAYTHSMGDAYAVADLIICRAGATTVAELKILNKRSILIPFPFATANHQEFNAKALEKEGLAKIVIEKDLNARMLAGIISESFASAKKLDDFKIPASFPQELLAAEVVKSLR